MAMGQGKLGAKALPGKGIWICDVFPHVLLPASHKTMLDYVTPRHIWQTSAASTTFGAKAEFLRRERNHKRSVCGDAKPITGSTCWTECPATPTITLIAHVVDDLCTFWPMR